MADPRWYYDARTGTIAQYPIAPDPGNWYRLIYHGGENHDPGDQVGETLAQGEYPLVTPHPPEMLRDMDPHEKLNIMQQLQRKDYEDPGRVFETNSQYAPGMQGRPAMPPTSVAPPWRPFDQEGINEKFGQQALTGDDHLKFRNQALLALEQLRQKMVQSGSAEEAQRLYQQMPDFVRQLGGDPAQFKQPMPDYSGLRQDNLEQFRQPMPDQSRQ
jgi:hypothetical protein